MKDNNTYEVIHIITISTELSNGISKIISSTFKIVNARSIDEAKKILNDATPKGPASNISESSIKSSKHKYVEIINDYIITHSIYIKKNDMPYKEVNNLSENLDSPMECIVDTTECRDTKKTKPNNKKTIKSKSKISNKNDKIKSSSKSKSKKNQYKYQKRNRTSVDYIE